MPFLGVLSIGVDPNITLTLLESSSRWEYPENKKEGKKRSARWPIVVKVRNMKMDFYTGGTWRRVGQWTLMMKIYDFLFG